MQQPKKVKKEEKEKPFDWIKFAKDIAKVAIGAIMAWISGGTL